MGTSAFQQSAQVTIQGKTYVLHRKVTDDIWQLEECRTKRIHDYTDGQLRTLYEEGHLIFDNHRASLGTIGNNLGGTINPDLSPEKWDKAKVSRAYVVATLDAPNTESAMSPLIQEVWLKIKEPLLPPNWTTVYRWKKQYLAAGKDITALVLGELARGNSSQRYPQEVTDFVVTAIDDVYLTREPHTIQDTLDRAITLVQQENHLRPKSMELKLPTRRFVKRMIDEIPVFDRYAARHGRTAAVKRFRSVMAHRTTEAPLVRAEIDHTLLDLIVIDDETSLPLGRPWITACIDDYSRCVLGIHISFEPPSHLSVSRCLKSAFLPKTKLNEQYPGIQNAWEAHGVMRELVVDNGTEFHSKSLENACYSLGIEIHYSARKTPWFKGKIERFLGTLNAGIAHGNPGTTFSNIFDKEDYDPSKHAVVRLKILQEIIRMWIVDYYHQKPHRALNAPPAAVWRSSISLEDILVPDNHTELDALLGRSEERRLTHKGIELYGLFYCSAELTALRMKLGDNLDVEVRVDDADIGHIVVFSPDKKRMFKVPAVRFDYANGLSSWQHRVCKRFAARELDKYNPESWLSAKLAISKLIEKEFMYKKQKTRAKIARFNGEAKPVIAEQSETPVQHPVPRPAAESKRSAPLTSADISKSEDQLMKSSRKLKPIHRERSQHLIADDQSDSIKKSAHV